MNKENDSFARSGGRMQMKKYSSIFVMVAMLSLVLSGQASAANLTWDGTGSSGTGDGAGVWDTASKWWNSSIDTTWTSGSDAFFGHGGAGGAVTLAGPTAANSLTFSNFSGTYTLGTVGQTLTITNGIKINPGAGIVAIASPISLGASQIWSNGTANNLNVNANINNNGYTLTYNSPGTVFIAAGTGMSGAGGLTKNGAGTYQTRGSHTYTGPTIINQGTLSGEQVGFLSSGANCLGQSAPVASNLLLGNGATLADPQGGSLTCDRLFTINGTAPGDSATIASVGSGNFNFSATGSLAYGVADQTRTLILGGGAGSQSFAPAIGNNGTAPVSVTKTGGNTWQLTGTNTYSGLTTISAGTLIINAITYTNTSQIVLNGTGRLDVNIANQSLARLVAGGGVQPGTFLRYSQAQTSGGTGPGTIYGTVELNLTGVNPDYTLDFGGGSTFANVVAANYTSGITLSGSASIDSSTALFTITTGGITASTAGAKTLTLTGSFTGTNTISSVIGDGSGTLAVTKSGAGTWVLTGNNTYTGPTTLSAGELIVSNANNLGAASANLVFNGGTLGITNTTLTSLSGLGHTIVYTPNTTVTLDLIDPALTFTVDQPIPANVSFVKKGAGTLVFSTANSNNNTTISGGVLQYNDGPNIPTTPLLNNGTLIVNRMGTDTQNVSFHCLMGGSGSLIKSNSGTLVLNGINLFTGTTKSSGGTLTLSHANALMNSAIDTTGAGTISLSGVDGPVFGGLTASGNIDFPTITAYNSVTNLTLNPNSGFTYTNSGVVANGSGSTPLTKTGAGTQVLQGVNTYSGATYLNAGTLTLSGNGSILNSAVTLSGGGITLSYADSEAEKAYDRVHDSTGITANGGTITYTTLSATSARNFAETVGSVALTSGQLNIVQTLSKTSGGNQTLTLANLSQSGTSVATFSSPALNTTYNRILVSGKSGAGAGQNLPGGVIIGPWATAGTTAALQTDYAVYDASGYVVPANITATAETTFTNAAYAYTLSVATTLTGTRTNTAVRYTGATANLTLATGCDLKTLGVLFGGTAGNTISIIPGTGGVLTTPPGANNLYLTTGNGGITVSAPINDNGGALTLVASGTGGTLTLSGANGYSGGTVINAGTVSISANNNLGAAGSTLTFNGSGGLTLSTAMTSDHPIVLNNGAVMSLKASVTGGTISAPITGAGGIDWVSSATTLTLSSTGNTFTGPIGATGAGMAVDGDVFQFASIGDAPGAGGIYFNNSGGGSSPFQYTGSANLTLNYRQLVVKRTASQSGGGNISNAIWVNGAGTLTINTDMLVIPTSGNPWFGFGGSNTGTNSFNGRIPDGAGAVLKIVKFGGGNWYFSGTNTYTGGTVLSGGMLTFQGIQALPASGTLTYGGGSGMTILDDGSGVIDRSGVSVVESANSGLTLFVGNNNTANGGTSSGTTSGTVISLGAYTFNSGNSLAVYNRTLNITGANGYSVRFSGANLSWGANGSAGNCWAGSFNPTTASVEITGTIRMVNGKSVGSLTDQPAPYLLLGGTATSNVISGNIMDAADYTSGYNPYAKALALTKSSTSTWLLSGTNTYTGPTTISGGKLIVNGSLASASVVTNSAGSLGGTGTIGGVVNLTSTGGIDTRDGAVGTMTIGNGLAITGVAGANNLYFDLGAAAGGIDKIVVTGNVSIVTSGAAVITLNQLAGIKLNAGTYDLITATGSMPAVGNFTLATPSANGNNFSLQLDGTSKKLQLVVVDPAAGSDTAWTGASSATWGTAGNWTAGVPGYGSVVTFYNTGAGNLTNTLDGGRDVGSLVYASGATTATTIGPGTGGILTLEAASGSGITVNTPSSGAPTHTISANVGIASNQTWTVNSGGSLTVGGMVSDFGGNRSLTKAGAGTLTLNGTNTYSGPTIVNGGLFAINTLASGGFPSGIGQSSSSATNLLLADGTTLKYLGGAVTCDRTFTINGTVAGHSATIDASGSGALNLSGTASPAYGTADQTRTLILSGSYSAGANILAANIADNGSGAVSVTKTGAGLWRLSGSNTFTGGVTINAGTLQFGSTNAFGTGTITINGGGLDASAALVNSRNNVQSWNGDFSFGSTANLDLGTGAVTLGGTRTVTANANTLTVGGVISGSGYGLTKAGGGTLALTTNNTYDGTTTVTGGTLLLSGANGTITNSAVMMAGGTLTILNANTSNNVNRLNDSSAFTMNGGSLIYTNDASANDFSEAVGTLTVTGGVNTVAIGRAAAGRTSTLTFAGLSRTSGTVNFSGVGLTNAVDTRGRITFTSPPPLTDGIIGTWATVNGTNYATIDINSNLVAYSGSFTDVMRLGAANKVIPNSPTAFVRIIEGSGGAANLTLAAATTTISNLLQSISGGFSPVTIDIGNGTNLLVNSINQVASAGSLTIGVSGRVGTLKPAVTGGNLLFVNSSINAITNNSVIADNSTASSVTKDGSGTLVLAANNTYSGGTVLNAGTLYLSTVNSFTGAVTLLGGIIQFSNGAGQTGTGPLNIGNGATISNAGNNWTTLSNSLYNINGDFSIGSGANNYVSFSVGNVILGGSYTITNPVQFTISGNISDGGNGYGLTKGGAGTMTLNGNGSSYTGKTIFKAGTLVVGLSDAGVAGPLGAPTGANAIVDIYNSVTFQPSGSFTSNRGLNLADTGAGVVTIYPQSNGQTISFGGVTATGTGAKTLLLKLGTGGTGDYITSTFNGAITDVSDGSQLSLQFIGGNQFGGRWERVYLNGVNTFSGPIVVSQIQMATPSSVASLIIGGAGQLGGGNYTNTITLASTGAAGGAELNYASSATQVLSGTISGSGILTLNGFGTLTLSAANTYTGTTTITNGTLLVNGSLAAGSAVTVISSGTLGGTGTVYGAVTVNSGGTNAPGGAAGVSLGVLNCATNVTIAGTLSIDVDDTQTPTCDKLAVGGALNITGSTLNIVPAGSPTGLVYVIASYGSLSGSFAATNGLPAGYVVDTRYNGSNQIAMTTIDVMNQPVTSCTATSALLNAQLFVPSTNADVFVYFGQADGTNNPSAWTTSAYVGSWTNVVSTNISVLTNGLSLDTTYYFTFRATNGISDVWASPSLSFRTLPTTLSSSVLGWDGGTTNIAENGDGASQGGNGNWNTTTNNWDQGAGSAHTFWNNAGNNTAIFGGTAGTVTLTNNITVGGLQFFTAGYMVRSNILTFGTAGNIAAYRDVTIASVVNGTVAVAKTGGGTLTLSGSNFLTGLFSVQTGTVVATTNWVGENRSNQTVQVGGYGVPVLWTNTVALMIGNGAVATNNAFTVGSNGVLQVNGMVTVGTNSAAYNSMTVSNASIWSGGLTVGGSANSNTLTLLSNAVWNLLGSSAAIGTKGTVGNQMVVNGGIVTNVSGTVSIGIAYSPAASYGNSLTISNGAKWYGGSVAVGVWTTSNGDVATNNSYNVGGFGAISIVSNSAINVGYVNGTPSSLSIASYNRMTVTNATLLVGGALNIGIGGGNGGQANNNSVWVLNGGTVNVLGGNAINVGNSANQAPRFNSLVITNGGYVSGGLLSIAGSGPSNSVQVLSGGQLVTVGASIGGGNFAQLTGGGSGDPSSTWNVGSGNFLVSGSPSTLTIDGAGVASGAVVTNVAQMQVGYSSGGSAGNSVVLTNGARLFSTNTISVGFHNGDSTGTSSNNTLTIIGGAASSVLNAGGVGLQVGASGTLNNGNTPTIINNQVLICTGGILTNVGQVFVGYAAPPTYGNTAFNVSNNQITVTSGGRLSSIGNSYIGYSTGGGGSSTPNVSSNSVTITGANSLWNLGGAALYVGNSARASATVASNSLTVSSGGILTNAGLISVGSVSAGIAKFNTLTVNNASVSSVGLVIGNVSSNNTVTVSGNSTWNLGGGSITNGIGASTGNVLTVSASVLTNVNALLVSSGVANSNSVVLSAGGRIYASSATITNNNFLTVGVDDAATPGCGHLAVSGTLNISNTTLNIVTNGAPASPVYVIGSYGTLAGSFAATNGLPSGWVLNTNYAGLKQIALVQPVPLIPAVVNSGATNSGVGVCTLQGMVTSGGVVNAWICWGTSDAGTNSMTNWPSSAAIGAVMQSNLFSTVASGLSTNVAYWYRCFASNSYGTAWASPAISFSAASGVGSGGIVTNYTLNGTNYTAHIYTNAGNNTFASYFDGNVEVLVIGGGGGSGRNGGGGGGAGGLLYTNGYAVTNGQSITVTVGSGGAGAISSTNVASSGSNSVFGTMTAVGGGGGASRDAGGAALSGGSGGGGGGGASPQLTAGANNAPGQGCNGGGGYNNSTYSAGGGGGGYTSAGTLGGYQHGGNGGNGYWSSISGVYTGYCGGGAGSGLDFNSYGGIAGTVQAGAGGGGPQNNSRDARPNSGGGGGSLATGLNSGDSGGGNGGSGIVIVRYVSGSSIVNFAPSAVGNNSAVLNAQLICPSTNYSVYIHWGTTDGTNDFGAWENSSYVGSWTNVSLRNISYANNSLAAGSTYYYTFRATNDSTNVWASPSWMFSTPVLGNPYYPYSWLLDQTNVVLQVSGGQTGTIYSIFSINNNLTNAATMLYQVSNTTAFTYINTNALGSVDRRFYMATETTSGVISTNSLIFTAFRKQLDTNAWYKFALGIDYGTNNSLDSTLGSQLAQGLTGNGDKALADLFYLLDVDGNWQMCYLNGSGVWCDYNSAGGSPTNTTVLPWQSFWIKRRIVGVASAPVYSGYCFSNAAPLTFRSNDWHMITWPLPWDRKESDGTDQGWGFAAAGAKKGGSWLNSDVLTVGDGAALRFYYLNTNGRWSAVGQTTPAGGVNFHIGEAYYYMHRGTGFTWTATQP